MVLVFGICGALRCDEITAIKTTDVEDLGNKFLVSINDNKNDYPGQFVIGGLFYSKVKPYISMRPEEQLHDRFFVQYQKGKCNRQPIGRHEIGEIPQMIATYLNLDNSKKYTGHSFRRTSATLLSESGANMQQIKQLGRWRSDIIAQGYVENSLHNRTIIYEGIVHNSRENNNRNDLQVVESIVLPENTIVLTHKNNPESNDFNLEWSDFSEEFNVDNTNRITSNLEIF